MLFDGHVELAEHRLRSPHFRQVGWVQVEERARAILRAQHFEGWLVEDHDSLQASMYDFKPINGIEPRGSLFVHAVAGAIPSQWCEVLPTTSQALPTDHEESHGIGHGVFGHG